MPSVELNQVWVRFPLHGAWSRSLVRDLVWRRLISGARSANQTTALAGVSLSLRAGQRLAVLGANGSGKTSLARVAAGLVHPVQGRAVISGRPFAILSLGYGSHPEATVIDSIIFHALLGGRTLSEARTLAAQVLDFGGIDDAAERTLGELSAGHLLRIGLGTALFLQSDIIVLDEVMDTADPEFVRTATEILTNRRPEIIVIAIERSRAILDGLCTSALILDKGRVLDHGDYRAIMAGHGGRYTF